MPLLDIHEVYEGTVIDIPQDKPNAIAYKVELKDQARNIICYLPKESATRDLKAGDSFKFFSKIEPFKRASDMDEFDYARYMYNHGFVGFSFVPADRWEKVLQENNFNIYAFALNCRQSILNFYKTLDLNQDEYALLSGLTLGYKDSFSEDLLQSFRVTGTAHILAVSGLHVGILYAVLLFTFSFIHQSSRYYKIKILFIILLLWSYCFIVGLPPSTIRACITISIFSLGEVFGRKGYSYNTIFIAVFFILILNPFRLFDIGFQLSFVAILSISLFMPFFSSLLQIKNKLLKRFWNILCLSISVQLGVLPLSVYYFGVFPTYFIITNLLIVPIVSFMIYDIIVLLLTLFIGSMLPIASNIISYLPIEIFKLSVKLMTFIVQFFENISYAYFENVKMSLGQLLLVFILTFSFIYFLKNRKAKLLIFGLISVLVLIIGNILDVYFNQNSLVVHNNTKKIEITYQIGFRKYFILDNNENQLLYLSGHKFLMVANKKFNYKTTSSKIKLDYVQLEEDKSISLYSLTQIFDIERVIIGSTISQKTAKRFMLECEKLRIPYYDLSNKGGLRINF